MKPVTACPRRRPWSYEHALGILLCAVIGVVSAPRALAQALEERAERAERAEPAEPTERAEPSELEPPTQEDAGPSVPMVPADERAWMTYANERTVGDGTGAYSGYTDRLEASGRYEMTVHGTLLQLGARYRWRYEGERCETGGEDRSVTVDRSSRAYVGRTDLDEYDDRPEPLAAVDMDPQLAAMLGLDGTARPLTTWVWIPPELPVEAEVVILEHTFRVVERTEIVVTGVPIASVHLRSEGTGRRDDAYGSFETSYIEQYWFDAATGYFLRSEYVEHDRGTVEGERGGFTQRERVEVTGASYVPGSAAYVATIRGCSETYALAPAEPAPARGWSGERVSAIVFGGIVVFFGFLVWASRSRVPPIQIDGQRAEVVMLTSLGEMPTVAPDDAPRFGPFLRHFVDHALRAGEKVAYVKLADGRCVGLGLADGEANVASIFAKDGDACELLRKALDRSELFTEHRHDSLPSVRAAASVAGQPVRAAYNVYETYEVLENAALSTQPYDATVISRMTEADLPAVASLSQEVWGIRGERWAKAALEVGDLGFVARLDGVVVGYAFASVCGTDARLYGNTVATEHRGKGLGRELARARLAAAVALGATRALTEVATWNVGSLEVMKSLGFAKVGAMWVESARSVRVERTLVRR